MTDEGTPQEYAKGYAHGYEDGKAAASAPQPDTASRELTPQEDAALSEVMPEVVRAIASAASSGTWKPRPIALAVLSVAARACECGHPDLCTPSAPTPPDALDDLLAEVQSQSFAARMRAIESDNAIMAAIRSIRSELKERS